MSSLILLQIDMQPNYNLLLFICWFLLDKLIGIMVLTNIRITIKKHCLKIIHYYRIQVIVVGPSDIELLCCIKNIDLCIHWSLITMRKKSTSEMMEFSLDFETVAT